MFYCKQTLRYELSRLNAPAKYGRLELGYCVMWKELLNTESYIRRCVVLPEAV